jgi:hypothetical protein
VVIRQKFVRAVVAGATSKPKRKWKKRQKFESTVKVEKGSRQNSPLIEPVLNGAKGKEINLRFFWRQNSKIQMSCFFCGGERWIKTSQKNLLGLSLSCKIFTHLATLFNWQCGDD